MIKDVSAGLLLGLLVGSMPVARAQIPVGTTGAWGSWFIGTVQLPGNPERKWGGYAEVQVRANGVLKEYFYHELKAGLSYDIDPNFTVLVGSGYYRTSDYRDLEASPLTVEKRLWEQLVLTQYSKRLKLEHRYRIEQRWVNFRGDSTAFRQRFRYRLNVFFPLNKRTVSTGTLFLSVYNELFLNPTGPVFERNRLYGGIGYQFTPQLVLQVGLLNQADYNLPALRRGQFTPQTTAIKNNLVLAVTYKLAWRSTVPATEHLPSQQD
ncbi:DUF2490 domain-containing protein [Hymenobacter antarcticus]|uniref:DUF2490 domain-containing protein n=1 Tax=Hymenobacter antarcticus TaxID=486270 RepID=A0ABP7QH06_9BACT